MEGMFYKYNSNFIRTGEIYKDKSGIHRFNKNEYGELRGGQIQTDKEGNLLSVRYIDDNSNVQTTLYRNGEIYSKFQEKLVDGRFIKSGEYEQYENGIVVKKGQYLNGELHGEWYMLNKERNGIEGKKYYHGEDITNNAREELKKKIENLAEETVDVLMENDPIRAAQRLGRNIVILFKSGKRNEKIPQIKINFKETPTLEENKIEKCYSSFYSDGSPKIFAEEAMLNEEGKIKFKGKYVEHFDNGKIKINANYNLNGNLDGKYREYYENGQLKYEGIFLDGKEKGIHTEFDKFGEKINSQNFDEKENRKQNFLNKMNSEKELSTSTNTDLHISKRIIPKKKKILTGKEKE